MLNFLFLFSAIAVIFYLLYKLAVANHDYFEKVGIKYIKPIPVFGNNGFMLLMRRSASDKFVEFYNTFPNEKIIGIYDFTTPSYLIRDLDLLKQITVKDFSHFQDHRSFVDPKRDKLFGNMLISMRGKAWRNMRSTLSPLFTGSKMKQMLQLVNNCADKLIEYLHEEYERKGETSVSAKLLLSRYTNDVIASCAFGMECNSLKDTDNDFLYIGKELRSFMTPFGMLKFIFTRLSPKLAKLLNLQIMSAKAKNLFEKLILETIHIRKEKKIVRPDMIQLLLTLKEGQFSTLDEVSNRELQEERKLIQGEIKTTFTDDELIAQTFIFFFAGFETTSSLMQFLAYELGSHQDVQQKLFEEIEDVNKKLVDGSLTYDVLKDLKYMSMVINETLRIWPPAGLLDRACVKDYSYEDESGLKLNFKKGDQLLIPIYAYHMDPKNFPNPKKFQPERFDDDNKSGNNMDAFLPFGIGPRSCIGIRFALMETKVLLYYILLNFKIKLSEETDVPLKMKNTLFGLLPAKEIMIQFVPRNIKKNV